MASPHVIAIQFDGLRADALNEERTPNLLAAAERGAWFRNHRSTFPTSTRVCVSSLATGVYPEKHGLPGNSLYSCELGRTITTGRHENLLAWERAMGGRSATAGHLFRARRTAAPLSAPHQAVPPGSGTRAARRA